MIGLICLALALSSCRRFGGGEPTARPTLTPTPRSTALPPVPTAIPVGSLDNPLLMKIVQPQTTRPRQAITSASENLQAALLEETGLTVLVEVVESDAEALAALCDSPKGDVTVAWLSGLAYAAAFAQECGTAALQVQRGARSSAATGDEARIIVNRAVDVSSVGDLSEHSFCRLNLTLSDIYSWLIPSLMLDTAGVSATDLDAVNDYDDAETLIAAVASGDCDAAGISASQYEELANAEARASIRTLQESVTIPFAVLLYPVELPLGQQAQLTSALVAIGNGSRSGTLSPLLDQDELSAVTDDDLSALRQFINRAGINLAQAGS
ncbi:MAG: PhnD/SsuA/transferrin family substrate-binding protein [Chloroflexota bacterium]